MAAGTVDAKRSVIVTSNPVALNSGGSAEKPLVGTATPSCKIVTKRDYWTENQRSLAQEILEVIVIEAAVTLAGWFSPLNYHAMGHVYLLMVVAMSWRVGRIPVFAAAVVSAVTWDFVFIPPVLSFSVLDLDESLTLGAYFFSALIGGQLTAQIRSQERRERQREARATALFDLTRALAAAPTFDDAVVSALQQANALFGADSALLLPAASGALSRHSASSLGLSETELAIAGWTQVQGCWAGRFTDSLITSENIFLPLTRAGRTLGVMVVSLSSTEVELPPALKDLMNAFASQIALLVEREKLREASEREQRLADSDRLHRTLLDCVSHELKTPLAVLRSAAEKLDRDDGKNRVVLATEITTATRRLDHLVANLLNQTRLEAGRVEPAMDWCDLRDLFATARRAVGEALKTRTVLMDLPENLPLIFADAVLMEQVLSNILLNAALHTPGSAAIRLFARVDAATAQILISLEDGGPGFSDEIPAHLFQKFSRGRTARPGGLGLGLSIVKGFMQAQGGDVVAGMGSLGGACFTLSLPHVMHGGVPLDEH